MSNESDSRLKEASLVADELVSAANEIEQVAGALRLLGAKDGSLQLLEAVKTIDRSRVFLRTLHRFRNR